MKHKDQISIQIKFKADTIFVLSSPDFLIFDAHPLQPVSAARGKDENARCNSQSPCYD